MSFILKLFSKIKTLNEFPEVVTYLAHFFHTENE